MGRPPILERFCNCPKNIETCCCSRKLPRVFNVELINNNDCECLNKFFQVASADITGTIPESIKFRMAYNDDTNRWETELNLADICCNKIWCFWFYCPERLAPSPCGPPKGGDCPPQFSCGAMDLRVWCRDICIDGDECIFETAFNNAPSCCNCSCDPCASIGWIYDIILGDLCSCGSVHGVQIIITCNDNEHNFPFECPVGQVPNCCCACTPSPLSVCILGSGGSECACYDGSDKCITISHQNKECGSANCEEFCLQGSLPIPGCHTLNIAMCCNFLSGAIVFTHNNCDGLSDPCQFVSPGQPAGFVCSLIDITDFCFVVGGSCCDEGPANVCVDISE